MSYEKSNQWVKHIDFAVIDLVCMEVSLLAANMLRHGPLYPFTESNTYIYLALSAAVLLVAYMFFAEPYSGILRRCYLRELRSVIINNVGLMVVLLVFLFAVHSTATYSRLMLGYFVAINIVITYFSHVFWKRWIRRRTNAPERGRAMILVVGRKEARKCVERILKNPYGVVKLCGVILLDKNGSDAQTVTGDGRHASVSYAAPSQNSEIPEIMGIPVIGNEDALLNYCKLNVVDDVLFFNTPLCLKKYRDILLNMGIRVHRNMVELEDDYLKYQVNTINGIMTLSTSITPSSLWQMAVKRGMDILGGFVGCLATLIIIIFVAPIIKIQAPGPIFFSQTRVGKNGRRFKIYKFRSMYKDAEERKKELMAQNKMQGFMFKMDNDPRIFPFGNILRKTSLDEFPQFFNVLKGNMSLCGTRPPTLDEYIQYAPHHKSRLAMKPGITGLWQVSGRSQITDFEEVVRLDNEYIRNWSLSLDLKILFKTVLVVFARKGSV